MSFRNLLVHVGSDPTSDQRLDAALALATAFDAHLSAFYLVGEPYIPAAVGVSLPVAVLTEQQEENEAEADRYLSSARQRAESAGVPIEARKETTIIDSWPDRLARQVRHADLVIIGQPNPEHETFSDYRLLVEASFMATGRPALIIPYVGYRSMPPRHIVIAWDASREAARAVNDALPLLQTAESITLAVVDADRMSAEIGEMPGADIATHLARHKIAVDVKQINSGSMSIGDSILNEAGDSAADLIVMGGYGHSRLRETVFGGTTRHILDTMTVPVLISH